MPQLLLVSILPLLTAAPPPMTLSHAHGLAGLGKPGGLLQVDPKVLHFESELLDAINAERHRHHLPPLAMDDGLRRFSRQQAKLAATGDPAARQAEHRIEASGMAPYGHRLQFTYGATAGAVLRNMRRDPSSAKAVLQPFTRIGIGAFWVPEKRPYYQVALLFVRDRDPMAGKPGLSQAQTDPVMQAAMPAITRCYNDALKNNPNLGGTAILQMIIGKGGRVTTAKLIKSLDNPDFDGCALGVAKRLHFPAPYHGKPVTLNHPMRFVPPQGNRRVGKLTPGQIEAGWQTASFDLRQCYNRANRRYRKAHPKQGLRGTISLKVTVATDGSVKQLAVATDTIGDAGLTRCVMKRARLVRFARPEFDGEVQLTYPLHFAPATKR